MAAPTLFPLVLVGFRPCQINVTGASRTGSEVRMLVMLKNATDLEDPFVNLACFDAIFWATSFVSPFGP